MSNCGLASPFSVLRHLLRKRPLFPVRQLSDWFIYGSLFGIWKKDTKVTVADVLCNNVLIMATLRGRCGHYIFVLFLLLFLFLA